MGIVIVHSRAASDLTSLSLEPLLEVNIVGASKYQQKQNEAAAVSIITRQWITAFGWRLLAEALSSLPAVHTTSDHQYTYHCMRGFGLGGRPDGPGSDRLQWQPRQ